MTIRRLQQCLTPLLLLAAGLLMPAAASLGAQPLAQSAASTQGRTVAQAAGRDTPNSSYLTDQGGTVVRNATSLCWHPGYWTPAAAIAECAPALVPKPASPPVAAPPSSPPVVAQ